MFEIQDVNASARPFAAGVSDLMPAWKDIPDEFKRHRGTKWNDLFGDAFFSGLKDMTLFPKEGVDPKKAMRHIRTVMSSFEPKHEHKEATVAFLFREWFEGVSYSSNGDKKTVGKVPTKKQQKKIEAASGDK